MVHLTPHPRKSCAFDTRSSARRPATRRRCAIECTIQGRDSVTPAWASPAGTKRTVGCRSIDANPDTPADPPSVACIRCTSAIDVPIGGLSLGVSLSIGPADLALSE